MSIENKILNWPSLKEARYDIAELKKQIKCRKCNGSLEVAKEFFGYRANIFQAVVYQKTPKDLQEVFLRDYSFCHFACAEQ